MKRIITLDIVGATYYTPMGFSIHLLGVNHRHLLYIGFNPKGWLNFHLFFRRFSVYDTHHKRIMERIRKKEQEFKKNLTYYSRYEQETF